MLKNNGTFPIPPETSNTPDNLNIAQVAAVVYQMLRDTEKPIKQSKKKEIVRDYHKILEKSRGKRRKKLIKKLLPLIEGDIRKSNGKGSKKKNQKGGKSNLKHDLIRDSAKTALRLTERYIESQFSSKDPNIK